MMRPANDIEVYLCKVPVDFRKGINGLAALVEGELHLNPFSEQLYVFINRSRKKVKILYWERSGFCLWQKSLEEERFKWPDMAQDVSTLTSQQLNWLLDGYDISKMKPHQRLSYQSLL